MRVPYSSQETIGTDRPSLRMEQFAAGLTAVVRATLANSTDVKAGGGAPA